MSDELKHLELSEVSEIRVEDKTPPNPYAQGYGPKVPTRYMLRIGNRWHRLYVMIYGNSGSPWINKGGETWFLSIDLEHAVNAAGRAKDGITE